MLSSLPSTVDPRISPLPSNTATPFSGGPQGRASHPPAATDDLTLAVTPAPNTGLKLRLSPAQGRTQEALHHQIAALLAIRPLDVELDLSDVNCITGNLVTLLMSLRRNITD